MQPLCQFDEATRTCQQCGRVAGAHIAFPFRARCKAYKGPDAPPRHKQVWNLAKALAAFVADGCKTVTAEQYAERLSICDGCEHRQNTKCALCGCNLPVKARGRAFKCPDSRWPSLAPADEAAAANRPKDAAG